MQRPVLEVDLLYGREWKCTQKGQRQHRTSCAAVTPTAENQLQLPCFIFVKQVFKLMLPDTGRPPLSLPLTFIPEWFCILPLALNLACPVETSATVQKGMWLSLSQCTQNCTGTSTWDRASESPKKEGQGEQTCESSKKTISFSFPSFSVTEAIILQYLEPCLILSVAGISQKVNLAI